MLEQYNNNYTLFFISYTCNPRTQPPHPTLQQLPSARPHSVAGDLPNEHAASARLLCEAGASDIASHSASHSASHNASQQRSCSLRPTCVQRAHLANHVFRRREVLHLLVIGIVGPLYCSLNGLERCLQLG